METRGSRRVSSARDTRRCGVSDKEQDTRVLTSTLVSDSTSNRSRQQPERKRKHDPCTHLFSLKLNVRKQQRASICLCNGKFLKRLHVIHLCTAYIKTVMCHKSTAFGTSCQQFYSATRRSDRRTTAFREKESISIESSVT